MKKRQKFRNNASNEVKAFATIFRAQILEVLNLKRDNLESWKQEVSDKTDYLLKSWSVTQISNLS